MSLYIINLSQTLKKRLTMIGPEHSISATIEGSVIDVTYVAELQVHTVLTYHVLLIVCGPARCLLVPILALNAKSLDTPLPKLSVFI